MKMRVRGNSIRLRLTQSEVKIFGENNLIEESIEFGGEKNLIYALESKSDVEKVKAEFNENRVVITIPRNEANNWINSNRIGIKAEQNIGGEKFLRLLIEKDFACLETREGEDESDAFPHPNRNDLMLS